METTYVLQQVAVNKLLGNTYFWYNRHAWNVVFTSERRV